MKIRQGFVSNSSSSSFVVATSVENHERALKQFDEEGQKIINAMMYKGGTLFGRKIMVGEEISTESYGTLGEVLQELDLETSSDAWETWNKYQEILKENKEEVFSCRMDF
jgi:hypothetical protein